MTARTLLPLALLVGVAGRLAAQPAPAAPQPLPRPQSEVAPGALLPQSPLPPRVTPTPLSLDNLLRLTVQRNPRLEVRGFQVEEARGRAVQAGLYPNPTVSVGGEEMGSRDGPGGILTAPQVSQTIVTGGKLSLSRAAAMREVDQATLALLAERFVVFTAVRQGFFEAVTAQRRVEILGDLVGLAEKSYEATKKLFEAKLVARLDVLQLQAELDRLKADQAAAHREYEAAFRRLAATVGAPDLPVSPLAGSLDAPLPRYEYEPAAKAVLAVHPTLRSAQVGVARAQLLLRRAQAEPLPNVTVGAGYVRNNIDRGDQWTFQVGVPIPLWNRNQGNIATARAGVGQAAAQVRQAENDLLGQLATAFGLYAAALERVERYRTRVLPVVRESFDIAVQTYKGGQFEYLRVLEAQRAVAQANLEYNRSLGDAWRAAGEIAGLTLEEEWPAAPPAAPERVPDPAEPQRPK